MGILSVESAWPILEKLLMVCGDSWTGPEDGVSHQCGTSKDRGQPWRKRCVIHMDYWLSTGKGLLVHIIGDNRRFARDDAVRFH